jgi:putative PIN family toxin of toxin-antitoxin system
MRVVVDTNIVFSTLLNTNNLLARILLLPKNRINFYSTTQLLKELEQHSPKIKKLAAYSDVEIKELVSLLTKKIRFIRPEIIPDKIYKRSERLTQGIDIDDTELERWPNISTADCGVEIRNLLQVLEKRGGIKL